MQLEIQIKLRAAVKFDSGAGVWVSWCPALDVYSQGTDRHRAQHAIEEALVMYVRCCYQQQLLEKVLAERGFTASKDSVDSTDSDKVFDEFIQVREVDDQPQHMPWMFDVMVPLPLVAMQQIAAA